MLGWGDGGGGMNVGMGSNLYLGLVHHPIYDKRREVVATAISIDSGLDNFTYYYRGLLN